ncbi:MAG: hypothetical protein M3Y87_26255 [Myxococcota bacterium]|nr:hypothetical protein [Myxococcota bacterium]
MQVARELRSIAVRETRSDDYDRGSARALLVIALVALGSTGCYLSHERGRDGAVRDGGTRDGAARDAARDVGVPDVGVRDAAHVPGEPCSATAPLIRLDDLAAGIGDPACRSIEMRGGREVVCAGIDVEPFRIENGAGGNTLLIHVTVLNEPPLIPGSPYRVALRSFFPETCECMGGGWAESDVSRTHTWMTGSRALEVGLANEAALYRVEACSIDLPRSGG